MRLQPFFPGTKSAKSTKKYKRTFSPALPQGPEGREGFVHKYSLFGVTAGEFLVTTGSPFSFQVYTDMDNEKILENTLPRTAGEVIHSAPPRRVARGLEPKSAQSGHKNRRKSGGKMKNRPAGAGFRPGLGCDYSAALRVFRLMYFVLLF